MYGICQKCGCTDMNCSGCIERTGRACDWVNDKHDLCSACDPIQVYGVQTDATAPAFIAFTDLEDLAEWIKSIIQEAPPGADLNFKVQNKMMTQEELRKLLETDI